MVLMDPKSCHNDSQHLRPMYDDACIAYVLHVGVRYRVARGCL